MKNRSGFTMVEIVIVLVIISLLGAMGKTYFKNARIHTYADAVVNELMTLDMGIQAYYETFRRLPTSSGQPLQNLKTPPNAIVPYLGPGFRRNKTPVGGMWHISIAGGSTANCYLYVAATAGNAVFQNANEIFAKAKEILDAKVGATKYRFENDQYRYYPFAEQRDIAKEM